MKFASLFRRFGTVLAQKHVSITFYRRIPSTIGIIASSVRAGQRKTGKKKNIINV